MLDATVVQLQWFLFSFVTMVPAAKTKSYLDTKKMCMRMSEMKSYCVAVYLADLRLNSHEQASFSYSNLIGCSGLCCTHKCNMSAEGALIR